MALPSIVRRYVLANGLRFHVAEAGRPGDPLILLLHGFPECWYSWRYQLRALAAAGYHVVAPDLRGYNLTEKPVLGYDLDDLSDDVMALAEALGQARFMLAGHDWGGVIAWWTAARFPATIDRLIILNAPHLGAYRRDARRPDQLVPSWYVLAAQLPLLPEWLLSRDNYEPIVRGFRRAAHQPQTFRAADLEVYREAIAQPGALHAALNYYRAAFGRWRRGGLNGEQRIDCPTLVLWGIGDPSLGIHLTAGLEQWVPKVELKYLAACGHWTQQEQPARVNQALLEFLGR